MTDSTAKRKKCSQAKLSSFFSAERQQNVDAVDESNAPHASTCKHRKSGFDRKWLQDFAWLEVRDSDSGMFCKLCKKHNRRPQRVKQGSAKWVDIPCFNFMRLTLTEHEKATYHNDALKMETQLGIANVDGGIQGAFEQVISAERKAFIGHLKCMYWLIKTEVPHTTNFESLIDLCQSLGCEYLSDIKKGDNASYTSERFMQEVVEVLGKVVQDEILHELKKSPFFAIVADETTDIAVLEQLILYARYINDTGIVKCSFLGTFEIPNCKSQTITDKICSEADALGLSLSEKMCGFGSDGASIMIGKRNGVAAKLKDKVPWLVNSHCVAHRLALACSQAADEVPYMKKFKAILAQLYRFYEHSSVRTAGLKDIQNVLSAPDLHLKRASDTRWLSHDLAVTAVRKSLPSVITSLKRESTERNDAQALGLLKFVCTYKFVACLYMMSDVLPILSHLSKLFQKKSLDFSLIQPLVTSTTTQLEVLQSRPGMFFQTVDDVLVNSLKDFNIKPVELTTSTKDDFIRTIYKKYLRSICMHIEERFPDAGLLGAFSIFDSTNWPDQYIPGFGEEQINELVDHYHAVVDKECALGEWKTFVTAVQEKPDLKGKDSRELLTALVRLPSLQDIFPNLCKLAIIALVIPMSSADCERGFSTLKRIKTRLRNRLSNRILNYLLMISIEGPDLQKFDFNKAVDKWAAQRNRRINVTS